METFAVFRDGPVNSGTVTLAFISLLIRPEFKKFCNKKQSLIRLLSSILPPLVKAIEHYSMSASFTNDTFDDQWWRTSEECSLIVAYANKKIEDNPFPNIKLKDVFFYRELKFLYKEGLESYMQRLLVGQNELLPAWCT